MSAAQCAKRFGRQTKAGLEMLAIVALGMFARAVGAEDLNDLQVTEKAGTYRVRMVVMIRAPAHYVHRVLTDYVHIYRLNPAITESRILPSPAAGTVRVMTRIGGCIAFLCRDIDRVEDVSEVGAGHLRAIIVPEQSDFGSGRADWYIQPFGDQSQVVYESEFEPAFFIPPLIGSHFVKRAVGKAVTTSFAKLECIARIQAGLTGVSPRELVDATPETMGGDAMSAALWDPIQGGTVLPGAGYDGRPVACRGVCGPQGGC